MSLTFADCDSIATVIAEELANLFRLANVETAQR